MRINNMKKHLPIVLFIFVAFTLNAADENTTISQAVELVQCMERKRARHVDMVNAVAHAIKLDPWGAGKLLDEAQKSHLAVYQGVARKAVMINKRGGEYEIPLKYMYDHLDHPRMSDYARQYLQERLAGDDQLSDYGRLVKDDSVRSNFCLTLPKQHHAELARQSFLVYGDMHAVCVEGVSVTPQEIYESGRWHNEEGGRYLDLAVWRLGTLEGVEQLFKPRASGNLVINASYNELRQLDPTSLRCYQNRLQQLCVQRNKISCMKNNFIAFTALQTLDLSYNKLGSNLSADSLKGLERVLKTLDLDDNELTQLPNLSAFVSLRVLKLSNNKLGNAISPGVFPCGLQDLDLRANGITQLPDLRQRTGLQSLVLCENELSQLPKNAFKDQKNLGRLYLAKNKLERISDLGLGGAGIMIDLSLNKLQAADFKGIKMGSLDLRGNSIKAFDFDEYDELQSVDLSENEGICIKCTRSAPSLELVTLSSKEETDTEGVRNLKNWNPELLILSNR